MERDVCEEESEMTPVTQTTQQAKQTSQQQVNPLPIILVSAKKENPGLDEKKFTAQLGKLLKNPANKLLQVGQSVFLMFIKQPGVIEFHTFSTGTPQQLKQDALAAVQTVKRAGAKHLYTFTSDPRLVKLVQSTGLPWRVSQSQQVVGSHASPAYRLDLDL